MKVRELIIELLNMPMDASVDAEDEYSWAIQRAEWDADFSRVTLK